LLALLQQIVLKCVILVIYEAAIYEHYAMKQLQYIAATKSSPITLSHMVAQEKTNP
jgi:hypothetical protein